MAELILSEADKGSRQTAARGDHVIVRLKENPTTGYQWALDQLGTPGLELEDTTFVSADTKSAGGGGARAFAFKAAQAGAAALSLKLWRQWQGDASIIDRWDVTVDIT